MGDFSQNKDLTYNKFLSHTRYDSFPVISIKHNEYIIIEGEKIDSFYFMLSGKIRIFNNYENGKTMLVRIFDQFNILGDIEYFLEREAQCSVQTIGEVKCIKVPFSYIDKNYRKDLTFINNILIQLSTKILITNTQATLNLMYSLDTRLASYLLSFSRPDSDIVTLPKLEDVSNNLGTSYRHLTRTIKKFVEKGAIMKHKKTITIKNRNQLLEISQGNVYEEETKYNFWG